MPDDFFVPYKDVEDYIFRPKKLTPEEQEQERIERNKFLEREAIRQNKKVALDKKDRKTQGDRKGVISYSGPRQKSEKKERDYMRGSEALAKAREKRLNLDKDKPVKNEEEELFELYGVHRNETNGMQRLEEHSMNE